MHLTWGVWPKHEFSIMSEDDKVVGTYQFTVIDLEDSVRVTEMFHNDFEHLQGKGIAYAMIERVHQLFDKEVTSSAINDAKKKDNPEFREPPATGVWESLKSKGLADWSPEREIFFYPAKSV